MDTQKLITVTLESAQKVLKLIAALENPVEFAELLEENIQDETRDTDDDAIKKFLQQPHIMCSGYDADILFFKDGARDTMQLYITSIIEHGVHVTGDKIALQDSIESMNGRLGLEITSERLLRLIIPVILLTKLALKFDLPSLEKPGEAVMATAPDNVFTTQVFKDQFFLLDQETLNRGTRDNVNGAIQGSYLITIYYCVVCIVCSGHVEQLPTMELDGFFITQMFREAGGLFSPRSINLLKIDEGPSRHSSSSSRNEADLSLALNMQIISPSRLFCLSLFELLEKYLPSFISQRKLRHKDIGFDRLLLHLTNILSLSTKMTYGTRVTLEGKATVRSTSRDTDLNIANLTGSNDIRDAYPPLLQESFVKPDLRMLVQMFPEASEFSVVCFELKANELWSSSTSGDVHDHLCNSQLLKQTEVGSSGLSVDDVRGRADRLKFLGCFRQMVLETLLSRSGTGILTNGTTCILLSFEDDSELVCLSDGELVDIPESDGPDGTRKRRKTEKTNDVAIENGLFKIKNAKLDICQRGSTSEVSSHLAFYVSARMSTLIPDVIDPFAAGDSFCNFQKRDVVHQYNERDIEEQLKVNEELNDKRMCRFFQLLYEHCRESALWVGLYTIQLKVFRAFSLELSARANRELEEAGKRLQRYLNKRDGPSARLVTQLEKDAAAFVDAITRPTGITTKNLPFINTLGHVWQLLKLLGEDEKNSGTSTSSLPAQDYEEAYQRPSTADEFRATLFELKPAAEVFELAPGYTVNRLIKGVRIPRFHGQNDGISIVLEVVRSGFPCILKIFDSVRIRASNTSQLARTRVATGFQPLNTLGRSRKGTSRRSRRHLEASDIIPNGKTPSAFESFANLSLLAFDIYLRECLALYCLRNLDNVPNMRRHGYITVSETADLLSVPEITSSKFNAEGLCIEIEKVDHVIEDKSITRAIGCHPTGGDIARRVAMRSVEVVREIHELGFTHGDLHHGNLLLSSRMLAGKDVIGVKEVLDGMDGSDDSLITPFFIDFGASMDLKEEEAEEAEEAKEAKEAQEAKEAKEAEEEEEEAEEQTEVSEEVLPKAIEKFKELREVDVEKLIDTLISLFFVHLSPDLEGELKGELREYYHGDKG